ncbi:hypothetical protein ACH4PU_32635 [Streptomyces sp. NPDC021100]|uniref:hypothetical protein n=1 Tax=Streptomyces sp. NPDC021100 TaxID=3365114 RepID=UPI0037ADF243
MTTLRIPPPRTPAGKSATQPDQAADTDPAGLTTFTTALTRWKTDQPTHPTPLTHTSMAPTPRLLHDQQLPPPPPGLPTLPALQNIAQAAAGRARRLLDGAPLPDTELMDAVHIGATTPGIDTTTAYRLNIDIGHWRDLVTAHRTGGCTAVRVMTSHTSIERRGIVVAGREQA